MADGRRPPIEAVIYDVDGTMYALRPMRLRMACQLAASMARRPRRTWRAVKVLRAYRAAQEAIRGRQTPAGSTGTGDAQLRAAAETLGVSCEAIAPIIEEWTGRRPLPVVKRCGRRAVLEGIRLLHEAGVRQGVYSDYPPADKLAVLGVADCIDAAVWSGQADVGRYKPSPEGFLRAAELLGISPSACVSVGDRPAVDGAGARAAGMEYVDVTELNTPAALPRMVGLHADGVSRDQHG